MAFGTALTSLSGTLGPTGVGAVVQNLQPNASANTTATSLLVMIQGIPQGLLRSIRIERGYDQHRIKVIGAPINAAIIPGVTEPTATISKAFLFGLDINAVMGGNVRPVQGKRSPTNDFTQFYFNIVEVDAEGNTLAVYHDCALASESRGTDIDSVIMIEEASIFVRWVEDGAGY